MKQITHQLFSSRQFKNLSFAIIGMISFGWLFALVMGLLLLFR